jgi:hypothetical protein
MLTEPNEFRYIVERTHYYMKKRDRTIGTRTFTEGTDKYEMLLWITDEFYQEFIQGGYLDESAKTEFYHLKDIYLRLKARTKRNDIQDQDKKNIALFIAQMEEIMPAIDRVYSMKAFW